MTVTTTLSLDHAREVAASVLDPEMPLLTLADLGVLRDVRIDDDTVVVTITPTYSGCPAMATMRADIARTLTDQGYRTVRVDTVLSPAWSTDWITAEGHRKLAAAGYSRPGPAPQRVSGPVPLNLTMRSRAVTCPQCGSPATERVSEFGATPCKALYRCTACNEPFDHVKEI